MNLHLKRAKTVLLCLAAGLALGHGSTMAQGVVTEFSIKTDPALQAMVPADARDKVLTAATSASVPPLLYLDSASNKVVGAVADLTHAYAARLGIKVELVKTSGDAVIPGVLAKRYDIVASMGDFISRRDKMDFVDIVKGGNALVTKKGNPAKVAGIDDLCGRKLAVNKGSIQERRAGGLSDKCKEAGKPAIEIMGMQDGPTAVLALQSGRVDVQWDDIASAFYKVSKQPNDFEVAGAPQDKDAPYGVGLPKEQSKLRDAIHAALRSLQSDGTYDKILAKWGVKEVALPVVINGSIY